MEGSFALEESALRALVDAAPDGVVLADEQGRILFANRQLEELFGFEAHTMIGRSVDDLLPEHLRDVHRAHRTRYRAEPRLRSMGAGLTLFGRRADGTEFPVEISLSPIETDDGLRVVAVVRDVRERLATEERLHEAEQHLRVVEERERIARDLHDIVIQKLFAAGMTIQSVSARTGDTEQGGRLAAVVDDLDETIREIRSVIFSLQTDVRDLGGVRAEILRVADDECAALGFDPRIRFDGPVDAIDPEVARQLLPTLREALSNVAKHARASSVEIVVTHDEMVTLRVVDNGRGTSDTDTMGHGIDNITERAAKLGGSCHISARGDGGTVLEWCVPASGERTR